MKTLLVFIFAIMFSWSAHAQISFGPCGNCPQIGNTATFNPSVTTAGTSIAVYGDSLTVGSGGSGTTFPLTVANILSRTVANRGVGGQRSADIIGRQGGIPILVSVTSNQIPASGAVSITSRSLTPISTQGPGPMVGYLSGVQGTMTATTPDAGVTYNYVFTRSSSGVSISIPTGGIFIPNNAVSDSTSLQVIWAGRNDIKTNRTDRIFTRNNIISGIKYMAPTSKRFLVMSTINGAGEVSGTTSYNQIIALNTELANTFGDRYIDVRRYLIDYGIADAGLTPTAQDTADIISDTVPTQLRSDNIHLNSFGYAMVGGFVARQIDARGW